MEDMSAVSRKDDKRKEKEFPGSFADIEMGASPSVCGDTAEVKTSAASERRQVLHRVPSVVRNKNEQIYDPLVVSFGPYHHGRSHLRQYEDFKEEVLNIILNSESGAKDKGTIFRGEILKRMHEIRSFYGGLSTKDYNDEKLVEMMIRDACLLLYYMEIIVGNTEGSNHLNQCIGPWGLTFIAKDTFKVENQIPWWVIKKLIRLKYDRDHDNNNAGTKAFICKYFSLQTFGSDNSIKQVPWEEGTNKEPLHLLEADRRVNLMHKNKMMNSNQLRRWKSFPSRYLKVRKRQSFRSAMELKAKGVYFRRSSAHLDDINFTSHWFHGVLPLPILVVDSATTTYFSNVIALEMSPGNAATTDWRMTSYVNFMKSLIEKPEDVKLLQEKSILNSNLENNEHIVKIFNEINTHAIDDLYMLNAIKKSIDEHCHSYSKTWIAELFLTKYRTPWSAIAVFAATCLLCLTFLQTYYTMNPG